MINQSHVNKSRGRKRREHVVEKHISFVYCCFVVLCVVAYVCSCMMYSTGRYGTVGRFRPEKAVHTAVHVHKDCCRKLLSVYRYGICVPFLFPLAYIYKVRNARGRRRGGYVHRRCEGNDQEVPLLHSAHVVYVEVYWEVIPQNEISFPAKFWLAR